MLFATYQEEIVLDKIVLKRLDRKRSIGKTSDEIMLSMMSPSFLDVSALQDVLDKPATSSAG